MFIPYATKLGCLDWKIDHSSFASIKLLCHSSTQLAVKFMKTDESVRDESGPRDLFPRRSESLSTTEADCAQLFLSVFVEIHCSIDAPPAACDVPEMFVSRGPNWGGGGGNDLQCAPFCMDTRRPKTPRQPLGRNRSTCLDLLRD